MTALRFSSEAAFAVAMAAGFVPSEVLRSPLRFTHVARSGRREKPRVLIDASELDARVVEALVGAGAERVPRLPKELSLAPWWPAVLNPQPSAQELARDATVLLRVPSGTAGLEVAAKLVELGATRVEIAMFHTAEGARGALVLATRPSHYLVARAMERLDGLAVFERSRPDRDDVWIEVGYAHEGLAGVRTLPGEAILVSGDGSVEQLSVGLFHNALDALDLEVSRKNDEAITIADLPRHKVELRLVRGVRSRPAALWVLREHGIRTLDRLVDSASEALLKSLGFVALGSPDNPVIVVRALSGTAPPVVLDGEAYAPLVELGDVYVPEDCVVHPPVGAQRLRGAVGGPDDRVRWLSRGPNNAAVVESAPSNAWRLLVDWVELVASHANLTPWVGNASFDPAAFHAVERIDDESRARRRAAPLPEEPPERKRKPREQADVPLEVREEEVARPTTRSRTRRGPSNDPAAPSTRPSGDAAVLAEAERALAEADGPLASPARDRAWFELAAMYAACGHLTDARISWARCVLSPDAQLSAQAKRALLDAALASAGVSQNRAWAAVAASANIDLLAALLIASDTDGPRPATRELELATTLCDNADARLDVRSMWLARSAIARLSGNDALVVARARDRALARLVGGLSLGRDLPRAVRALEIGRAAQRTEALSRTLAYFETTPRPKGPLEADPKSTLAYVRLVFACAFARAGDASRARNLVDAATQALPVVDPVHSLLVQSFGARVSQAIEAEPEATPLPAELSSLYEALGRLDRYKVDRVRQACRLLEPDLDLDPFRRYGAADVTNAAAALRAIAGAVKPSDAARALDDLLLQCSKEDEPILRRRAVSTAMTGLLYAPLAVASPRLDGILALARGSEGAERVRALSGALNLAERLERDDLAGNLVLELQTELSSLPVPALLPVIPHVARAFVSLKRSTVQQSAVQLLRAIAGRVTSSDAAARSARLTLTAALLEMGFADGAEDELAAEARHLEAQELTPADRLQLARSVAACAAAAQQLQIVTQVATLWRRMTDSYNTNTHLCLSAVELADAVTSALSPRVGDAGARLRQLVDEDEHAVRHLIFGS